MTTAFFTDSRFSQHTHPGHPEHAGRLETVVHHLEKTGLLARLSPVSAIPASEEALLHIHTQRHVTLLKQITTLNRPGFIGADTYYVPQSYELARLAAGGVVAVVDAVMQGQADNGLAAIRPPGHHATPSQAMGFCLLNNIALAAAHARATYHLQRIAVVDFDVHHGNGTQDIFYADPQVLFISSHQSPLYPGTGILRETGAGAGEGYTVNLPVPAGTGDTAMQTAYEKVVVPLLTRFQPQLILVSAGFDGHWADPLAGLELSLTGFDALTRLLIAQAQNLCAGRIVFVMEGGYDVNVLAHGWGNIVSALLGDATVSDPLGQSHREKALSPHLLAQFLEVHQLKGKD